MIFDILLLQKQNKCEAYFVRGRHSNCDWLHLSQNYFKLPCQTIQENANFFCLFPQDQKNIDHIYNDHVSQDMTKEHFKKFANTHGRSHRFLLWLIWPRQILSEIQIWIWWLFHCRINGKHRTSRKNWENYFSENFNSDCGFREFDKNKDDFQPTNRVGPHTKVWDGFGEFRDVLKFSDFVWWKQRFSIFSRFHCGERWRGRINMTKTTGRN